MLQISIKKIQTIIELCVNHAGENGKIKPGEKIVRYTQEKQISACRYVGWITNPYPVFLPSRGPKVTYVPPPLPEDEDTIFAHYASGINFNKYDDILVDVSGLNPPQAIYVSVCPPPPSINA